MKVNPRGTRCFLVVEAQPEPLRSLPDVPADAMAGARRTGAKSEVGKTLRLLPQTSFKLINYCASKAWFVCLFFFFFFFFKKNSHFLSLWGGISSKPIVGEAITKGTTWHWSWPWFNIRSQIREQLLYPKGNCCCPVTDTDGEITLLFLLHCVWQRRGLRNIKKDIFISLVSFVSPSIIHRNHVCSATWKKDES